MVIIDIDPHRDDRVIGHTVAVNLKVVAAVLALTDVAPAIVGVGVKVVAVRYILVVFHAEPAVPVGVAQIVVGVAVVVAIGRVRLIGAVAAVQPAVAVCRLLSAAKRRGVDFRLGVAALKDHGHTVKLNGQQVTLAGVGHGRGIGVGQRIEVAVLPLEGDKILHVGFAGAVRTQLNVEVLHIDEGKLLLGEGVLAVGGGFQHIDAHIGIAACGGALGHVVTVQRLLHGAAGLDEVERHALSLHIVQGQDFVLQGAGAAQAAAIQLEGPAVQRPLAVGLGAVHRYNALALIIQVHQEPAAEGILDLRHGAADLGVGCFPGALIRVTGVRLAGADGSADHCYDDHKQEYHRDGDQDHPFGGHWCAGALGLAAGGHIAVRVAARAARWRRRDRRCGRGRGRFSGVNRCACAGLRRCAGRIACVRIRCVRLGLRGGRCAACIGIAAACLRLQGRLCRLQGRRCSLSRLNRGLGHSCGLCGGLRYGYFCTAILAEFSTGL